ncbi:GntR family transcriptional regulator [Craterilacuibacter sp. RT1T]|uniref:GntR family transcriptional regulator n=1 Tax=Craterilacuibacter sp. RT1T TaxID=2942211 RepID=UPI0020C0F499|nr:GntR family transcriptional regulator [Craterilacuibacter sp. RT1T]MCL6263120.1 GntR family transcriptional regulator [Craterilacuibacter sp. RT1T]
MTQTSPSSQSLTAIATDSLRQRILAGEWSDGRQLRQEALSRELGMSRVPIREALRQLETEGLVTIVENKGAVVSQLSLPEIVELLHVRVLLECDALMTAIPRQTSTDLAKAEALLAQFETALRDEDIAAWGILNARFHLELYRAAGQPQILAIIEQLHNRTDRYTRMQILLTGFSDRAHHEHNQLLELCRKKDSVSATAFLRQHILHAQEALETWYHAQSTRPPSKRGRKPAPKQKPEA